MRNEYYFKFEDLNVCQKAIEYGEFVNMQIEKFPKHELFRLSSQFIRAADSIALNSAEGSGSSDMNFNRDLKMAWESAHECVAASTKTRLRNYISFEINEENKKQITEISKMISGLQKHLKSKK